MSYFLATCLANVLRGTTENVYGDQLDTGTPVHTNIPMSITERSHQNRDPVTGTPRTIRSVQGLAAAGTDIRDTDQILDTTHNRLYAVQSVTQDYSEGYIPDLVCDLKRIT